MRTEAETKQKVICTVEILIEYVSEHNKLCKKSI